MTTEKQTRLSPHKNSRHGAIVEGVVIHYTATATAEAAVKWFEHDDAKVSAHFVVDTDGKITRCVFANDRAWHAGKSKMPGLDGEEKHDANTFTIGIELANAGKLVDRGGVLYRKAGRNLVPFDGEAVRETLVFEDGKKIGGHWATYPEAQINALNDLLDEIAEGFGDDVAANVYGHEEIAIPSGRKVDPGPAFPWHLVVRRATERKTWPAVDHPPAPPPEPEHTEATNGAATVDPDDGED